MYYLDGDKESVTSNRLFRVTYGKHVAHVVDAVGCKTQQAFYVEAPEMKIPSVLTPNGDGVNDYFNNVRLQEAFPNAKVNIYDRWGKLIVSYNAEEAGWDGTYNGKPLPSTDYWYEIEVKEINKTYTGHFTLLRQ